MLRTLPQVAIRLPADVKAFIKAEAQENASSQNSEIVRAIRAAMKAKRRLDTRRPVEGATQ